MSASLEVYEQWMTVTVIFRCSVSPVVMSSVTDGLMATTGMVVNDLLSGVTAGVSSGSIVPTDLSADRATPMVTNVVPGVIENAAAVGLVDVPVTSNALIAALHVPMLVSSGGSTVGGAAQVVGGDVKVGSNPVVQQQQAQQQPPASIPQEIATMSEHDLISYINPNCFEQGEHAKEEEGKFD